MHLLLITDSIHTLRPLTEDMVEAGYRILEQIRPDEEISGYLKSLKPDAVVVIIDEVDRDILKTITVVMKKRPMPIIVLTQDASEHSIDAAVKAGVSAYVVDCSGVSRIDTLLRVAQKRFDEQKQLRQELENAKNALSERKQIEKAKGIIMKQKNINEEQAYTTIRKLAMNKNKRVGEIAEQIIAAADVLL